MNDYTASSDKWAWSTVKPYENTGGPSLVYRLESYDNFMRNIHILER